MATLQSGVMLSMSLRYHLALWSLAATVFAIPWQEAVVIPGVGSVVRLLGALALILSAMSIVENDGVRFRSFPPFLIVAGVYVFWTILSFFWTVDTSATRSTIITHAQLLLFVWAIWQLSIARSGRRLLAQAYVLGSFVAAGNVLYVFVFHSERINLDGRTTALGGNHNDIAAVMAIAIAMAWWLMTQHRGRLLSVVNLLYVPIGVFAIVLTGSRGGTLAAVVALAAIVLTLNQVRPVVRLLVACAVLGTVAVAMTLPPDIQERALPALERVGETAEMVGSSDLTGRTEIWRAGYEALRESPIVGYGGDAFPSAVTYWLGYAKSAHNTFLAVAVNTGLIGLALFCLVLLAVLVSILWQPRSATRTTELVLFAVLLVSIFPLGWEYYKTTWFVLAVLGAGPLRSTVPKAARLRNLVAEGA